MAISFHRAQLDNGLTILCEADDAAHSSAVGFFVRTGARDEDSGVMGVSHFLEHMMFKGTPTRSAAALNEAFDRLGASNNAYTSGELTCFYATVLPEHLGECVDIIADMMRPALREDDFTTEKGVILEEIAMYEDNPFWVLYERAMEAFYPAHGLGHRVLGTKDTITALSAQQMRDYFGSRYSADNTVVALAGKLDFDRVAGQIERLCGSWSRTGAARDSARPRTGAGDFDLRSERFTRWYTLLLCDAPAMDDDRRYAASLVAQILGGPDNSRLHWALIETGLAEEAQAAYDPRDGAGDFLVYASGDPDRADEINAVLRREMASLADSLVPMDLDRLRARFATGVTVAGERPGGRMQRLGRQWTYLRTHTTLEEELARINAVTLDDLRTLLREYPIAARCAGTLRPA